ncbi:M48 family metallopeptidase [Chitinophaga filiformis]|uniref:M48 family metallopeptidase n=1 Tax=Chitinophaga filiformis TaxID=104663 RepID=A0ABY4I004_CHIFI|nr:M48 family metallopeptidase [Chitinophaga filiformis]UPK69409.1 M48 family metallopeptidase [Chitinophaga filiformis]
MMSGTYFKQEVLRMTGGVLLFYVTYIILLLCSLLLLAAFTWSGSTLIAYASYMGISGIFMSVSGAVLIVLGILQVAFIVLFLFSRPKTKVPYRTVVTEKEQPVLFDFIHKLVQQTRTALPKKVYLVPDVNAVVFHSPGIAGLFGEADKNLVIGLGMVNSLNISEFKMVLAHEFGHFSQRSMKLVLHVYTINRIIYNILYENKGWRNALIWLSNKGLLAALLSRLFVLLAAGLHFLFRNMHELINRQYMRLSREMEFNADEVALSICGTDNAISAMRRAEMSNACFLQLLQKVSAWAQQQRFIRNIYEAHSMLIKYHAKRHSTPLDHQQLPQYNDDQFGTTVRSQVQFRDRWASHPTQEEREQRYLAADIPGVTIPQSAWTLFHNAAALQEQMSRQVYQVLAPEAGPGQWETAADLIREIEASHEQYAFPAQYNNYYNDRPFSDVPSGKLEPFPEEEQILYTLSNLYAKEHWLRIRHYFRDIQDAATLQAIISREIQVAHFTYGNVQYRSHEAPKILDKLQQQIARDKEWLQEHDQLCLRYHYTFALQHTQEAAVNLEEQYKCILSHQTKAAALNEIAAMIMESIPIIYSSHNISREGTDHRLRILRHEATQLQQLLQDLSCQHHISDQWEPDLQQKVAHFIQYQYPYLREHLPSPEELETMHEISAAVSDHYNNSIVLMKKDFLYHCLDFSELSVAR